MNKLKLNNLIDWIKPIQFVQNHQTDIENVLSIDNEFFNSGSLGWCSNKNIQLIQSIKGGTLIVSSTADISNISKEIQEKINFIIVENPRKKFAEVLEHFFVPIKEFGKIEGSAKIDSSVQYRNTKVNIGHNVVIEKNCTVGEYVTIDSNTVIKEGTIIEDSVSIGSNCTIGGVGFGYERNEEGIYEMIPHIGNVHIHPHVEIGNNVCIDRAVLGSTILSEHVKVDNLVHIAHGVIIGKNTLVIANAMIAGSVRIGENTWVAPSSSIIQKVEIGDNVTIGLGSVVIKDVESNDTVVGVPAKKLIKN